MNIEEVKSFEEHKDDKEVKDYLKGLKTVSVDDVKGFQIQKKVNDSFNLNQIVIIRKDQNHGKRKS